MDRYLDGISLTPASRIVGTLAQSQSLGRQPCAKGGLNKIYMYGCNSSAYPFKNVLRVPSAAGIFLCIDI